MKIIHKLFPIHQHHWGIPHTRTIDSRPAQTCYECSQDREGKVELRESAICKEGLPGVVLERGGRMFGERVEDHSRVGEKLAVEGTQTRARKAAIAVGC